MADEEQPNPATAELTPTETLEAAELIQRERILRERKAIATALDGESASHEGGFGAQGGQTDFGHPKGA